MDIIESEAALKKKEVEYDVVPPKRVQRPKNRSSGATLSSRPIPLNRSPISREDLNVLMKKPSVPESLLPLQDNDELAGLNETQRLIADNYAYIRNQTVKSYTQSIDQLNLKIAQLKADLDKKLEALKEEEKKSLSNWEEEQLKPKIQIKTKDKLKITKIQKNV